ncbi:glycosyltransferase family 4 protein [Paenarthrobacter aurescens]|uniref:Glycosyl transferase family 1 n=1 Tax=Paenarthrobacter aurescens TaxID=43663 RepID=A0A4Y3NC29_PAEAU|nr:glycosyltransferase family 4 protein [Paenarthrobacter aurescens]MDO6143603.1 glycosyltransferase family 1 protein [Paenarthrobacter aurescens]MDO6147451.1 glycosyltransferase family 1 protein [Paenarthrobacter aurescens]MDO6158695.1 glycosyltransferase family 1 protein [Paenarthrobacter aurescens]MDO6162678.1 glycosyltransferase family 1 protein [Paenarthrobacter aurescens]GEB19252.1 glycosyl transferase family 1 [Paenarthrobacter aurescens]
MRSIAGHVLTQARQHGWRAVTTKVLQKTAVKALENLAWAEPTLPLRPEDIMDAEVPSSVDSPRPRTGPLEVGWVCTPPGPGSGGHTTFFRMVQGMAERGHRCTLFLYDRNSDDVSRHAPVIRQYWPDVDAHIRSVAEGFEGMDAVVASSWPTAYATANRRGRDIHSFYFIQDYEPYFYPRGTLYWLAENSYRLGFTNIALGEMITAVMKAEIAQVPAATVPFACDTATYRLLDGKGSQPPRQGVVHYAKRAVDRRGYLLAKLALEQFHSMHPEQEIHVYGDRITGWSIPVINHGNLSPAELNELYNRTIAGLAISFTNISLVPEELLAAGNVPVLNESAFAAQVMRDPDVMWAPATPRRLAEALAQAVEAPNISARAAAIAQRRRLDWSVSRENFATVLESVCAREPGSPGLS